MKFLSLILAVLAPLGPTAVFAQSQTQAAPQTETGDAKNKPRKFKDDFHFDPPATAVVKDALNVRGQPALKGEVVAHLHKGDSATVLELMSLRKPRKGEPAGWARIALPSNTAVWIFADYVDQKSMIIRAKKVNLRGGPGENYSVLGLLEKGASVKEVGTRNDWIQIETPPGAYGFVDADFLDLQTTPAPPPAAAAAPAPPPEAPAAPAPPVAAAPAAIVAPEPTAPTPPPAAEVAPPAKNVERIVTREGMLRRAYNIQAPADYELRDAASGEVLDYIQPQPKQEIKGYVGARVLVSGPEVLDPRWPKTPILEVQTLDRAP